MVGWLVCNAFIKIDEIWTSADSKRFRQCWTRKKEGVGGRQHEKEGVTRRKEGEEGRTGRKEGRGGRRASLGLVNYPVKRVN